MESVKRQIQSIFHLLNGDFVVPKNAYEKEFCKILGWYHFDDRYYDAYNGETFIELKKGQGGMHFDMVRYSEIVMGFGKQQTVTVFFRWSKKNSRVEEAFVIDTRRIIQFLKIDRNMAKTYLKIYRHVPRGVNILASATAKDLRSMAQYIIKRTEMVEVVECGETSDSSKWPKISLYIYK